MEPYIKPALEVINLELEPILLYPSGPSTYSLSVYDEDNADYDDW